MRQVPENLKSGRFLIIGHGRLAQHLAHYFSLEKLEFTTWARQHQSKDELKSLCQNATHVLLAISDPAISQFYNQHYNLSPHAIWLHFSGAQALPGMWSAHPLMTFSRQIYTHEQYKKIPFIVESEGPKFTELLPGLSNANYPLPAKLKLLYHAHCAMAGNFTVLLWEHFFNSLFTLFKIPASAAAPYLEQTFVNLSHSLQSGDSVLTGPIARRDHTLLAKHLEALNQDAFLKIYKAFVETHLVENGDQHEVHT